MFLRASALNRPNFLSVHVPDASQLTSRELAPIGSFLGPLRHGFIHIWLPVLCSMAPETADYGLIWTLLQFSSQP